MEGEAVTCIVIVTQDTDTIHTVKAFDDKDTALRWADTFNGRRRSRSPFVASVYRLEAIEGVKRDVITSTAFVQAHYALIPIEPQEPI